MAVQFDTSSAVDPWPFEPETPVIRWSDLGPFTRGYVEALFASLGDGWGCEACRCVGEVWGKRTPCKECGGQGGRPFAFSDLAPETLARIIGDCAIMYARRDWWGDDGELSAGQTDAEAGAEFWRDRNAERWPASYPPQTPYLGDDGKFYLREAA